MVSVVFVAYKYVFGSAVASVSVFGTFLSYERTGLFLFFASRHKSGFGNLFCSTRKCSTTVLLCLLIMSVWGYLPPITPHR